MITIWADTLAKHRGKDVRLSLRFHCWDNGDAHTEVTEIEGAGNGVPGVLHITSGDKAADTSGMPADKDQVLVVANWQQRSDGSNADKQVTEGRWKVTGSVLQDGRWEERTVQVMPLKDDLFSRAQGIFETDIISDACVLVAGLGSVGSLVSEELAKQGVMNQILIDYQRVETVNVARHMAAGIQDSGRYKTKVMKERILNKNPYADIEIHEIEISWQRQETIRSLVRRSDIAIGSVDNREPREVLTKLCVEEDKPLLIMGAFHRAYGVQILFTRRPRIDPCYTCFLISLPEDRKKHGFLSLEPDRQVVYSDRPVDKVEPALSLDIAPMSIMTAKLGINYLLRDKPTTLRSLDEDFSAPLYRYINRREPGTKFEKLEPLGFNAGNGKQHILSWEGLDLKRNLACPVCGDFLDAMSKAHGIPILPEDAKKYECETGEYQDGQRR